MKVEYHEYPVGSEHPNVPAAVNAAEQVRQELVLEPDLRTTLLVSLDGLEIMLVSHSKIDSLDAVKQFADEHADKPGAFTGLFEPPPVIPDKKKEKLKKKLRKKLAKYDFIATSMDEAVADVIGGQSPEYVDALIDIPDHIDDRAVDEDDTREFYHECTQIVMDAFIDYLAHGGEIAAGADTALLADDRGDPAIEHLDVRERNVRPAAGVAAGVDIDAAQHCRARPGHRRV